MTEPDAALRRVERMALVFCGVLVGLALVWRRGQLDVALGVLGGAALAGASYWAIKWSVSRLTAIVARRAEEADVARSRHRRLVMPVLILILRYGLLGLFAYVMIARLRLHPMGLLLGASSVAAAAAVEAMRAARS